MASYPDLQAYQKAFESVAGGLNYYTLEGWVAAQVVLEALRRCGRELTRPRFVAALRALRMRVSTMEIDFTGGQYTGSRFVELVQVRSDGSFLR